MAAAEEQRRNQKSEKGWWGMIAGGGARTASAEHLWPPPSYRCAIMPVDSRVDASSTWGAGGGHHKALHELAAMGGWQMRAVQR